MIFTPKPSKTTWNVPHFEHPGVMGGAKARLSRIAALDRLWFARTAKDPRPSDAPRECDCSISTIQIPAAHEYRSFESEENNSR
jgi:hypothetical protein